MKTVGHKVEKFVVTGVKPGALTPDNAFEDITDLSFEGKWFRGVLPEGSGSESVL